MRSHKQKCESASSAPRSDQWDASSRVLGYYFTTDLQALRHEYWAITSSKIPACNKEDIKAVEKLLDQLKDVIT